MALLHLLHTWREDGLNVHAVHIHHGLRGDEADGDEKLVRTYCEVNDIPLTVVHAKVREIALSRQCGLEEAGRLVRYEAFEQIRCEIGAQYIVTAHTANDVAETMLMHLVRGCGVGGLTGIPSKRGCIVRPLLSCTRQEIEAYCAENDIPYVVDSTNTDVSFTRNRIRCELLPLLRQMNPSVENALLRLRDSAEQDETAWQQCAERVLKEAATVDGCFDSTVILQQPESVRVRLWKTLLAQNGCYSYTERHIDALENALQNNRGTVCLPNGYCVTVSADRIKCFGAETNEKTDAFTVDKLPFCFVSDGQEHTLQVLSREEMNAFQNVHKLFFKCCVDYDKIQGDLLIRLRRDGDAYHPARRAVGKTLKKLFQELRVPTYRREQYPLLCDEGGIVLVPGVACDKRVCPDDGTKHFLVWRVNGEPSYTLCYLMNNVSS